MPRVAAIGLDAGEWQLIEPMLARGQLPNLARIRRKSAECRLRNPLYRGTLVWEAFLTGRQDEDDVRSGGVEFDPAAYRVRKVAAGSAPTFYTGLPDVRTIAFRRAAPLDGGSGHSDRGFAFFSGAGIPPGDLRRMARNRSPGDARDAPGPEAAARS